MTAKEFIESRQFAAAGKINTKDALIAVELADLEGHLRCAKITGKNSDVSFYETLILDFKTKNNIA